MKKKKQGLNEGANDTINRESIFGVVPGVAPAARDGHTCEIS